MITYNSIGFYYFCFFAVMITLLLNSKVEKKYVLLVTNLGFQFLFFYFLKTQLLILFGAVLINWIIIKLSDKFSNIKKEILTTAVLINIISFIFIKYNLVGDLNHKFDLKFLSFIGISFFTFRMLSLLVDLNRKLIVKVELINMYNYLTFFPTYLSGPIDRYESFTKDVELNALPSEDQVFDGVYRFVVGAFKKVIIADLFHDFTVDSTSIVSLETFSFFKILISLYFYAIVLYFDFSGYSDMAIGIARVLGITTSENFDRPYLARNIQDFWNRWHMSFMSWLRDYVYYPFQHFLLKTLKLKNYLLANIASTFLIFIITGLWHGKNLNYLYYGLYHGVSFTIYLLWRNFIQHTNRKQFRKKYLENRYYEWFSSFLTIHYFVFGLIFFVGKYEVLFK